MASYRSRRGANPACVLTIIMGLCTAAWSAEYGGGTADDPYEIWTPEQMNAIGTDPNDWDKHFKLMADIDLSAYDKANFNIIGQFPGLPRTLRQISVAASSSPFRGVFNGDNHTISNFHYACEGGRGVGLFGYVDGVDTEIKNVRLASPRVDGGTSQSVGSLVGALERGNITNCHVEDANVAGQRDVGALVGYAYDTTIVDCGSNGMVRGSNNTGGLVGEANLSTITNCCSSAVVMGDDYCGGLAGFGGVVTDSYATGAVVGRTYVGGLVGSGAWTITHCYATGVVAGSTDIGGLVGYSNLPVVGSF